MSNVTVDPAELRKCADLLYASGAAGADDAYSYAEKAKTTVSGKMVPTDTTTAVDGASIDKTANSTWVPFSHGLASESFYTQLTAAMIARDSAADAVKTACKGLAEALNDAADQYEAMDNANRDYIAGQQP